MTIYKLLTLLANKENVSREQALKNVEELETFRSGTNTMLSGLAQLMFGVTDNFKGSDEVLRNMGELLLMITELDGLCEGESKYYREIANEVNVNSEVKS